MAWVLQENKNEGYPTNTNFPSSYTADWSGTYPWGWILQPQYNDGYPFRHPWFPTSSGGSGSGGGGDIGGDTPWEESPFTKLHEGYWTGLGGSTYISSLAALTATLKSVQEQLNFEWYTFYTDAKAARNMYKLSPTDANYEDYLKKCEALSNNTKLNNTQISDSPNTNYTDCFLSCMRYPFDITPYFTRYGDDVGIWWGKYKTYIGEAVNAWEVNGYTTGQLVQGGELYVEKRFDNFLNYAPYTIAELYIPYCGSVPIDLEVFAGHTIKVKYLVDWFTGACIALIYRDNVVVDQIVGQIGTPLSIIAEDIQTYQNAMFSGSQVLKSQKANMAMSVVNGLRNSTDSLTGSAGSAAMAMSGANGGSGGAIHTANPGDITLGLLNGANNVYQQYLAKKTAEYNLDHTTINFKQLGSNGPSVGSWNEQECRLVLYYPTFLEGYNPQEYGHTVGFACLFNDKLKNFSGLTVCASVDTSGLAGATEAEKNLIEDALKSGVYL